MKGIILAAGKGTRLYPLTDIMSKQLFPVYDKPMIYYPLSTLMLLGITEILIITTQKDKSIFHSLLGDGSEIGVKLEYKVQEKSNGIADAFIIGEQFIDKSSVTLILGDNLFYGYDYINSLKNKMNNFIGAIIFGYWVKNPSAFGVVEFDNIKRVISLQEKPNNPKSNYAIPGLYIYDNQVINFSKTLKPSERGELEITDLNNLYLKEGMLHVELLDKRVTWLDTGTQKSLIEAGKFIETIESKKGIKVGCIEEVAYQLKLINRIQLSVIINNMPKSDYRDYLDSLI